MSAAKIIQPVSEPPPSGGERAGASAPGSFVRFEPPDICFSAFVGDTDADTMRRMNDDLRRLAAGREHIFLLIDQSRAGLVSAEARRIGVEGTKGINVIEAAVFGASFQARVVMTLVARVLKLLRGEKGELIHFFATEAEARARIAKRRRELCGGAANRD